MVLRNRHLYRYRVARVQYELINRAYFERRARAAPNIFPRVRLIVRPSFTRVRFKAAVFRFMFIAFLREP